MGEINGDEGCWGDSPHAISGGDSVSYTPPPDAAEVGIFTNANFIGKGKCTDTFN
jgi:hypothetical protein